MPKPSQQTEHKKPDSEKSDSVIFQTALFATASMTVLGATIIAPSLPHFEEHFASVAHIDTLSRLVLTLPALFIMLLAPLSGFLLDKYGRLKFLYPAILVWSLSGAAGFLLEGSIYWILASRAVFGMATAFVMTAISTLVGDYYQGAKRERALGLQGFFMAGGGAVFLILGGFLSDLDWRYPFLVYLSGLGILILAMCNLYEPERKAHKKLDSKMSGKSSESTLQQGDMPQSSALQAEKFSLWKFLPIYVFSFYAMSMFYAIPTQIPHFITHELGKSGDLIGASLAVSSLCTAIVSLFYGRLRARLGIFMLYFIALWGIGGGFLLIGALESYSVLLFALVLVGSGLGIILVNNTSWLLSVAADSERARAAGFLSSSVFMGQFCSPFLTQPLVRLGGITLMLEINGIILLCSGAAFLLWHIQKETKIAK